MKVRLLSFLSVVLVLSIKAYETSAREALERKEVNAYQPDLSFFEGVEFNPVSTVDSVVQILSEGITLKDKHVGFAGLTPKEYELYELMRMTASQDELNNLLTHYSPVVRVYAYRALKANEMAVNLDYEETLLKDTASLEWFSGCVLINSSVQEIVSQGFID